MTKLQKKSLQFFLLSLLILLSLVYHLAETYIPSLAPTPTPSPSVSPSPTLPPILGLTNEVNREQAQVKRIIDGDTIELIDGRKVRYIGMDTPETQHPRLGKQCFGLEAKEKNRELVEGKVITMEKDVSETDRYGRLLRYVWVDEILVNEELVKQGYAVASSYPPDISRQEQLRAAEALAREQGVGLWGNCPNEL